VIAALPRTLVPHARAAFLSLALAAQLAPYGTVSKRLKTQLFADAVGAYCGPTVPAPPPAARGGGRGRGRGGPGAERPAPAPNEPAPAPTPADRALILGVFRIVAKDTVFAGLDVRERVRLYEGLLKCEIIHEALFHAFEAAAFLLLGLGAEAEKAKLIEKLRETRGVEHERAPNVTLGPHTLQILRTLPNVEEVFKGEIKHIRMLNLIVGPFEPVSGEAMELCVKYFGDPPFARLLEGITDEELKKTVEGTKVSWGIDALAECARALAGRVREYPLFFPAFAKRCTEILARPGEALAAAAAKAITVLQWE
jgi:hypothetical protein